MMKRVIICGLARYSFSVNKLLSKIGRGPMKKGGTTKLSSFPNRRTEVFFASSTFHSL